MVHMKRDVLEKVPAWAKQEGDYQLMFGDDIDSLATATVIKRMMGYELNRFYNFEEIYELNESDKEVIGCDIALERGKTWDNHLTLLSPNAYKNKESVNMNVMYNIHRGIYTDKYAGSTLMMAWSFYGMPISKLSSEGKYILLAIDSAYLGYYNPHFKKVHNEWMKRLGFEELIWFMDNVDENDFKVIIDRYRLNGKIFRNKVTGELQSTIDLDGVSEHLGINLDLPKGKFRLIQELSKGYVDVREFEQDSNGELKKSDRVFSFAMTSKNNASFTIE